MEDIPQTQPQDELTAARAQAEEYLAGWKRAKADYANLKNEQEKTREEVAKYAAASLATSLLPVLDSFTKAMAKPPAATDVKAVEQWMVGISHVRGQLDSIMKNVGIKAITEDQVPFDPMIHEAMMAEKHEGAASGMVLKILEPGYKMHDRVLRAARVVIAE